MNVSSATRVKKTAKRKSRRGKAGRQGKISLATGKNLLGNLVRAPAQQTLVVHKWSREQRVLQSNTDVTGTLQFLLSDIGFEFDAFQTVFQQYRIELAECMFRPVYRMNFADEVSYVMPLIYVAGATQIPNNAWADVAEAQSTDSVFVMDDSEQFCVTVQPEAAMGLYNGVLADPFGQVPSPWISTQNPDIRHYGIRYAISGGGIFATAFQEWVVNYRLRIAFRFGH